MSGKLVDSSRKLSKVSIDEISLAIKNCLALSMHYRKTNISAHLKECWSIWPLYPFPVMALIFWLPCRLLWKISNFISILRKCPLRALKAIIRVEEAGAKEGTRCRKLPCILYDAENYPCILYKYKYQTVTNTITIHPYKAELTVKTWETTKRRKTTFSADFCSP